MWLFAMIDREIYIRQLEETISKVITERDEAIKRSQELEKKYLEVKKRLAYYENSNSPPSARKLPGKKNKNDNKKPKKKKKRGAPKGHKGATRPVPEPDEVIDVIAEECESCGSLNIEDLEEIIKKIIEEIPPPKVIKVTQFDRHRVRCQDCGHVFISKHRDCPIEGRFGPYLLVYMTMLKYQLRGTLRKIEEYLDNHDDFQISPKGILDSINRVGQSCRKEYDQLVQKIRSAKWLHIDETGIHVNGDKWWLWAFRTDEDDVLIVIEDSRGAKVPERILGGNWDTPVIIDGWRSYSKFTIVQRCWAHLLRKVDAFKDVSGKGMKLSKEIHRQFKKLRKFIDSNASMEERERKKKIWDKEMEDLVKRYESDKKLGEPLTYIRNGLGKWYTCLLYPSMEPTNNLGEQAIRESVIVRKIIGTFRSETGSEYYQYIASLLATWRLHGKNMFVELERTIRENLCLA